jgi:hypothetical protein
MKFPSAFIAVALTSLYAIAATITVQPGESIHAAVLSASSGDTIRVEPGVYEEVVNLDEGQSNIRIESSERHAATTRGFKLDNCDAITIDGFLIEPEQPGGHASIRLYSSNHQILNNYIRNTQMRGGEDGAIWLNWRQQADGTYPCKNIVIRGNKMEKVRFGLQLTGDDLLVENNEIHQLYNWDWHQGGSGRDDCDYARGAGSNITLRNNWFHGEPPQLPDDPMTGNAHVDGWQAWNYEGDSAYIRNLVIEGNIYDRCHQGMLLQNRTERKAFTDITIRNNVYMNCTTWMLSLGGAEDVTIENNVFYKAETLGVVFHDGTGNSKFPSSGVINRNIFYAMKGAYNGDPNHVSGSGNVLWQTDGGRAAEGEVIDPGWANPGAGDTHEAVRESFRPSNPQVVAIGAGLVFGDTTDKR